MQQNGKAPDSKVAGTLRVPSAKVAGTLRVPSAGFFPGSADGARSVLATLLAAVVDAGLAACIFVVPMIMGGRHALGQFALEAIALTVTLAWLLRQCLGAEVRWRRSPGDVLLPAGLVLLLVQLAPLGPAVLGFVSPHVASILPLWTGQPGVAAGQGTWTCVSMAPGATRGAIPLFLAYAMIALITVQRIRGLDDVERLLRWIALSAASMAAFGLVQWALTNGKFFWFYEHPYIDTQDCVQGAFSNRNHFAQFLALGIGPLVAWLQIAAAKRKDRAVDPLRLLALGVVLFAALLSLSRGGAVALFIAAAVSVGIGYRMQTLQRRFVFALASVAALIAVGLAIHGYEQVNHRLGSLASGSLEKLDGQHGRRAIWTATARAVPDFFLLGSGAGSFAEVYPMYLDAPGDGEYTHAENSPLQLLLETGFAGLGLMLTGIGFCAYWCRGALRASAGSLSLREKVRVRAVDVKDRPIHATLGSKSPHPSPLPKGEGTGATLGGTSPHPNPLPSCGERQAGERTAAIRHHRVLVCAAAVAASLAANTCHAMVDFVWYVPGCMAIVAVLAACAYRLWQIAVDPEGKRADRRLVARPAALGAAVILAVVGGVMVAGRFGPGVAQIHWDRYLHLQPWTSVSSASAVPADSRMTKTILDEAIGELEQTVAHDPDHARAHLYLAHAYLRRFDLAQQASDNAMPLSQIGDAAIASRFPSADAVRQWIRQVVGSRDQDLDHARDQTRRALRLCPLQGEGYLFLAQLSFLAGPGADACKTACIQQALTVRPFEAAVLFEAGKAVLVETRDVALSEKALGYWRKAFRNSESHRRQLIEMLAGRVPIELFLTGFEPDLAALRMLHARYAALAQTPQAERLRELYLQQPGVNSQSPAEDDKAAGAWLQSELRQLRRRYLEAAEAGVVDLAGREAAEAWLEIAGLRGALDDPAGQIQAAEKAVAFDPSSPEGHRTAGQCLIAAARFADAEPYIQWCLQRQPGDRELQSLMRRIARDHLDRENRTIGAHHEPEALR